MKSSPYRRCLRGRAGICKLRPEAYAFLAECLSGKFLTGDGLTPILTCAQSFLLIRGLEGSLRNFPSVKASSYPLEGRVREFDLITDNIALRDLFVIDL